MRHGTSNRRQRNRGNGGRRSNHQRTQVYDSNGPDVRIRGTAHQVCEKYLALAKDASSSGDWIMAENYYQHAEHYQRIINGFDEGSESDSDHNPRREFRREDHRSSQRVGPGTNDDLSLPRSILGDRTNVAASEDADQREDKRTASVAD
ncbi:MAG: DUF4167 domain-containing protein [Alphaproteobacteria bacterium]|nr:DUF4167 domain-containing protein [Alphaproteobacteria bacterium]MCB9974907.1 DUF4167 domain-containing protein [Rhodospirillales bacterium]